MTTDKAATRSASAKRRTENKEHRINTILNAARQVFFAKGYVRATMDEIAAGAGVSKPVVYSHFSSKDALFFSLVLPVIDTLEKELLALQSRVAAGDIADGHTLVRGYYQAARACYDISPDSFRILMFFQLGGLIGEMKPEIRDRLNQAGARNFDIARKIFAEATAKGWIRETPVHDLIDVLWGATIGIMQLQDAKLNESRRSEYKNASFRLAEELMLDALVAKPAADI